MGTGCAFTCPDPPTTTGPTGGDGCSPTLQNCFDGEKCMPWANDGGIYWNATRCSALASDPAQLDEPCTVEGSDVSGVDDCDIGLVCWRVNPKTNEGICAQMCNAVPGEPTCPGDQVCSAPYGTVFPLCVPPCDPLAPDCSDGDGCHPAGLAYGCLPPRPAGTLGAACPTRAACEAGLVCIAAENLDACENEAEACCTTYCDTAAPGCAGCTAFFNFEGAPTTGYCP